ncbi:hypothetical protein MBAV_000419 [Candidatus Magnetobacterium bavaricum]|uniref:Uncharacterized protein n=1 Tax=Candidatus Magnetobacterium bavaricum TaxID=29290 RepID=A0A0F3GZX9_9BACT|nr:hypothetical protein MBAV_000419 [Candidatus Magnetobacterium bavaricum]
MLIKKNLTKDYLRGYNQDENCWKMDSHGLYGQRVNDQGLYGLSSTKNNRMEKTPYLYSKGGDSSIVVEVTGNLTSYVDLSIRTKCTVYLCKSNKEVLS